MSRNAAGVILAAGSSARMGTAKQELELGGEPMIRRVALLALAAGLHPVVVVLPRSGQLATLVEDIDGVRAAWVSGPTPGDSLRAGIRSIPPGSGAVVVLLADMPFVPAPFLRRMAEQNGLAAADHGGEPGPPWHLPGQYLRGILESEDSRPLRRLACASHVTRVPAPPGALRDIDTPGEYMRARRAVEAAGPGG